MSKWDIHVKATNRRNERIRLQSEATKLRSAFVTQDSRLTGAVPAYLLNSCLKAGGVTLPGAELRNIYAKFKTSDGHFAWLRFCESLETGKDAPSFHPKPSIVRPVTAGSQVSLRRGTVSQKFLATKASRRSLMNSASADTLGGGSVLSESKSASRLRSMVSEASLVAAEMSAKAKDSRVEGLAQWFSKQDLRPATAGSLARPPSKAQLATAAAPPQQAQMVAPPSPAPPLKKQMTADQKKELKDLLSMAESGLNSRFSDMYKAFQYVDLDRSGRLSKSEIARALDLWNIPLSDDKLDLLLEDCDADGDGGVSYEEFVDKLARETVAPAAMGKRGMQSAEAMGVDAYELMDQQLGHGGIKKHNVSINS